MDLSRIQEREASDSTHYFPSVPSKALEYLGVALAGEVGEVCNEIKKWSREDFGLGELIRRLEGELPDVLIYLVMLAEELGIELEDAYRRKKAYNDERYRGTATETT